MKNKSIVSFTIFLLAQLALVAQLKEVTVAQDENHAIKESGFTQSGNFYVFEHAKGKPYKTRYRVWDTNFNLVSTITLDDLIRESNFGFTSNNGKQFTYYEKDRLHIDSTGELEDISTKDYWVHKYFMTDQKLVFVAQKILHEEKKASEFILIVKNLSDGEVKSSFFEIPEDYELDDFYTSIIANSEDNFTVAYNRRTEVDGESKFCVARYNYSGKIIEKVELDQNLINPEDKKFQNANLLDDDEFAAYERVNGFGRFMPIWLKGRNTTILILTSTNFGYGMVKKDVNKNAFYTIVGFKAKKGNCGILLQKFNESGDLIWKKQHVLDDVKFQLVNGANKFLTLDIYSDYLGVNYYGTRGKIYSSMYLLDKETGEIHQKNKFKNFRYNNQNKSYNGTLKPDFEIESKEYSNLILDQHTIFATLYNDSFKSFVSELNSKDKFLIKATPTATGLNVAIISLENEEILFKQFKI